MSLAKNKWALDVRGLRMPAGVNASCLHARSLPLVWGCCRLPCIARLYDFFPPAVEESLEIFGSQQGWQLYVSFIRAAVCCEIFCHSWLRSAGHVCGERRLGEQCNMKTWAVLAGKGCGQHMCCFSITSVASTLATRNCLSTAETLRKGKGETPI